MFSTNFISMVASGEPAFDPDALDFFARVGASGGILSSTEEQAVNQLVKDLKSYNLWSSMLAIYPIVGGGTGTTAQRSAACSKNLKSASFNGTYTAGWTYRNTGVQPTSGNFMNTGLNASVHLTINSAHQSFYLRTSLSGTNGGYGAIMPNFTNRFDLIQFNGVLSNSIGTPAAGASNQFTITNANQARSLLLGSRTSSTLNKVYSVGVLRDTKTGLVTTALPNANMQMGKVTNAPGNNPFNTTQECAFYSIGLGLDDTQAADLYTAVQAFQTTLNRQV